MLWTIKNYRNIIAWQESIKRLKYPFKEGSYNSNLILFSNLDWDGIESMLLSHKKAEVIIGNFQFSPIENQRSKKSILKEYYIFNSKINCRRFNMDINKEYEYAIIVKKTFLEENTLALFSKTIGKYFNAFQEPRLGRPRVLSYVSVGDVDNIITLYGYKIPLKVSSLERLDFLKEISKYPPPKIYTILLNSFFLTYQELYEEIDI